MKTIKHEIYKHGSYLYGLKGAGFESLSIDEEIKKMEALHEIAPSTLSSDRAELSKEQQLLLKDFNQLWDERKDQDLSCKTAAVFEVLDSEFEYKVYGTEIDEVVEIFISEKVR